MACLGVASLVADQVDQESGAAPKHAEERWPEGGAAAQRSGEESQRVEAETRRGEVHLVGSQAVLLHPIEVRPRVSW